MTAKKTGKPKKPAPAKAPPARRRPEEALRESEELLSVVYYESDIGIFIVDVVEDGRYVYRAINPAHERLMGIRNADVAGKSPDDLVAVFGPKAVAEVKAGYDACVRKREALTSEHCVPSGAAQGWWLTRLTPLLDEKTGRVVRLIGNRTNITERKLAEATQAGTSELLERTGAMAKVGGWELDLASSRVTWSMETARIHEVDVPYVPPLLETGTDYYSPDAWPIIQAAVQAAIDQGTSYDLESPFITAKGRHLWVRVQGFAVMENGKVTKLRGTLQDITARKQAESALRASEEKFARAFRSSTQALCISTLDDGKLIDVNDSYTRILGFSRDEAIGHTTAELGIWAHPADRTRLVDILREDGSVRNVELELRNKAGDALTMVVSLEPLDIEGAGYVLSSFHDITAHKRAAEVLHASERNYRDLIDHLPSGLVVHGPDTAILMSNALASAILGLTAEQMAGSTAIDARWCFLREDGVPMPLEEYPVNRVLASGEGFTGLVMGISRPDRTEPTWVLCTGYPAQDEKGHVVRAVINFTDITERKQAEAALRESNALFSLFLRHSPFYSYIKEVTPTKSVVLQASDSFQQMLGVAGSEIVGKSMADLFPPELAAKMTADDWAVVSTGDVLHVDEEMHGRSYSSIKFPIVRGDRTLLAGYTIDVTEHKRAEDELKASHEEMQSLTEELLSSNEALAASEQGLQSTARYTRTLIETSLDPLVTISATGTITDVNVATERVTGLSRDRLIGSDFTAYFTEPDKARAGYEEAFARGQVTDYPLALRHTSGTVTDVLYNASVYRDERGEVLGVFAAARDMTDHQLADAENQALQAQLVQAQKADSLGRMAGAIAHNYNNILGAVLLNLELAQTKLPADSGARINIAEAMTASRRAAEISHQMLAYLGQDRGKREPVDLGDVCREALAQLPSSLLANARITTDFLRTQGVIVKADAGQLKRVLTYLAANAGEAIGDDNGSITVSLDVIPAADLPAAGLHPVGWKPRAGTYACLALADTGCGMTPEILEKVFDPFFSTKFTGRGLGLPVVMGIVKAHEGACAIESSPGHGTTFRVLLPVVAEQPTPTRKAEPAASRAVEARGLVLVVEDEPMLRTSARTALEFLGFDVVEAADGAAAVAVFRQHRDRIRGVLCDVTMPGMDGWATLEALRHLRPDIAVILTSGYDEAQVMAGEHAERPQGFLRKPYSSTDLKAALAAALAFPVATAPFPDWPLVPGP